MTDAVNPYNFEGTRTTECCVKTVYNVEAGGKNDGAIHLDKRVSDEVTPEHARTCPCRCHEVWRLFNNIPLAKVES